MSPLSRTPRDGSRRDPLLGEALALAAAVSAYGLSYGVLATAAGLSPLVATLSSVVVFAGSAQFAFVGVLAAGGSPLTGALGGVLLNLRYLAFGFAMAPHLPRGSLPRRMLDGHLMIDESVALALAGPRDQLVRRFRLAGLAVGVGWVAATALGAYGGQLLGDPRALGLDAAFPAGFLALLAPWLRSRQGRVAAVLGVGIALALTPVAPPGIPVVAAALGAVIALRVAPEREDRDPDPADDPPQETP